MPLPARDAARTYQGTPFPQSSTDGIVAAVDRWAQVNPDAPFLTAVAADGQRADLTYGALVQRSRRFVGWLRHEVMSATTRETSGLDAVGGETSGVVTAVERPASVVALIPRNSVESVLAVIGVLRAGHAVLLLSPTDPTARLREQIEAIGAVLVLRDSQVSSDRCPDAIALPDTAALPDAIAVPDPIAAPEAVVRAGDDALCFGTSGSTASSKLVAQSHYNIVANAEAVRRHHGLRPGDRVLGCLPIHHVNGLHFTVFGIAAAGAHVVLADGFQPFQYPGLISDFEPRIASVVPSVLEALCETWRAPRMPSSFGYFVSAAAPLTADTAREVPRRFGVPVLQGYGLTETTNFSTTVPADITPEAYQRLLSGADIPSIGVAVYGNEVAVLRADGSQAAPDEVGEICMRGHNVMTRYAGNPEATEAAFQDGWFHSQDLGFHTVDPDTGRAYLVITGRGKNMAKVGGASVSLDEMERVLRGLPGVRDAACVRVPHRFLGEEIVAAIVYAGQARPDVRAHLRTRFAEEVLPRDIVTLDAVPRTATGKVLRPQLARLLLALA